MHADQTKPTTNGLNQIWELIAVYRGSLLCGLYLAEEEEERRLALILDLACKKGSIARCVEKV